MVLENEEIDRLMARKKAIQDTLAAQARDILVAGGNALRQFLRFAAEQRQLFLVVEAQQPATAIANRAAVILLEPVAGMLDLAFA